MEIEVFFVTTARIAGHRHPDIVQYQDGPLVRALLKAGHAVLIDPPLLEGYNEDEHNGENNNSPSPAAELFQQPADNSGHGEESKQRPSKSKGTRAKSNGGLRKLPNNNSDNSTGTPGI